MSVRQHSAGAATPSAPHLSQVYMACEDCGEGAMVWDPKEQVSKCSSCQNVYEAR